MHRPDSTKGSRICGAVKFATDSALELRYLAIRQVGDSLHIGKLMLGFGNKAKLVVLHCGYTRKEGR